MGLGCSISGSITAAHRIYLLDHRLNLDPLDWGVKSQPLDHQGSPLLFFSCSVMPNSLQPHGLQHARLPCPWPSPRVCSNSCPLSQWCHPTISFSVVSFSSCPLSYPAFGVFSSESALCIRCPKYWSFSFSTSPSNEYSVLISFRMNGLISLQSKGLSRVFSNTTVQKHQFFGTQLSSQSKSHIHTWLLEKP